MITRRITQPRSWGSPKFVDPLKRFKKDLYRKNLLVIHGQEWWTDELHFLDAGWIYHFNAIPPNPMNRDASYWIQRTYEELF